MWGRGALINFDRQKVLVVGTAWVGKEFEPVFSMALFHCARGVAYAGAQVRVRLDNGRCVHWAREFELMPKFFRTPLLRNLVILFGDCGQQKTSWSRDGQHKFWRGCGWTEMVMRVIVQMLGQEWLVAPPCFARWQASGSAYGCGKSGVAIHGHAGHGVSSPSECNQGKQIRASARARRSQIERLRQERDRSSKQILRVVTRSWPRGWDSASG